MRVSYLVTLFCGTSTVLGSALGRRGEPKCPKRDGEKDSQVIAHYKTIGACFSYIGAGNREKALAPCSGPDGYCQKVKKSTSGVEGVSTQTPFFHLDPSHRPCTPYTARKQVLQLLTYVAIIVQRHGSRRQQDR